MKLTEWARASGVHPETAYRWWREGILPVPARKVGPRTILVDTAVGDSVGAVGLYARVSSHDQREDPERQVARISDWAAKRVSVVVVEHRDRLGRMNTELVEAALAAAGRRLVVLDEGEVTDDLVRDMVEVLTSFCARLYGRRSARNRAEKALRCAERDVGPMALSHPDAKVSV